MTDPDDIHNWRRLDARLTTSGQPTEAQLPAIAGLGVKHVINLALHTHELALPDEGASVAALGMRYIHIPVDFQQPTDDHFARFCAAMDEAAGAPVHVHCILNYRVSAFLYRYRTMVLGWPEAAARPDLDALWTPHDAWVGFVGWSAQPA